MGIKSESGYDSTLGGVTAGAFRVAPWHDTGDCVDSQGNVVGVKHLIVGDPRTVDEITDLASGRWEPEGVLLSDLLARYGAPKLIGSEKVKLIIRSDKDLLLGRPSNKYGIIYNKVGFTYVAELLRHAQINDMDGHLVSIVELFGGEVMFCVIEFDKGVEAVRHNGQTTDKITRYMGVCWSHNSRYNLMVKFMNDLWVCRNTFTPWNAITGLDIRHTINGNQIAVDATPGLAQMIQSNKEFDAEVQRLIDIEADQTTMYKVVGPAVLGERDRDDEKKQKSWDRQFDKIMEEYREYTDQETAFDCVMAVQGWEQHRTVVRGAPRAIRSIEHILNDDYEQTKKAVACFDPVFN